MSRYESEYVKLAKSLVEGKKIDQITLRGRLYKFSEKQSEYISNFTPKFFLFSGGRGCGKSLALVIKMHLMCKGFPGIPVLLGRRNISDIEKTVLQDFFKIVPPSDYEYRVKDGIINYKNGSKIIMLGLDAMQSGSVADLKKAEQKTKSMNIGAYFIDQLEEVEHTVFDKLNDTMRTISPEVAKLSEEDRLRIVEEEMGLKEILENFGILDYPRQGNMTTNPANFWAYHYFKLNERMNEDGDWIPKTIEDSRLLEGSMLDNKDNLPPDFIKDRMNREDSYVRRFVYGEWNMDVLTKGAVFAKEHIRFIESLVRPPVAIEEGCEIYIQPENKEYRMGIDPSEGVVDPSSITVIDDSGRKVAKFNGMIPIQGLAEKVKFLYYKYRKPLIIPEVNAAGAALLREIRDLRVYYRKHTDYKYDKHTDRLGFKTSSESKNQLISHFVKLLRLNIPKIYDRKTVEEMKVFLWSDEARQKGAGAARSFHDDDVMSTMLAFWEYETNKIEAELVRKTTPTQTKTFQYH